MLWVTIGSVRESDRELEASRTATLATLLHPSQVTSASFSPDGAFVLTACVDGAARVWDWEAGGKPVELYLEDASTMPLVAAVFSRSGSFILTASAREARVWEWRGEPRLRAELRQPGAPILSAAFSPDERLVLTGGADGAVRIWDWRRSGGPRAVLRASPPLPVLSAAFSPGGRFVATGSAIGLASGASRRGTSSPTFRLRLLTASTPRASPSIPPVRASPSGAPTSPRGCGPGARGELVETLLHSDEVTSATFSGDGRLIVTGSADGAARVWDWRAVPIPPPVVLRAAQPDPILSAAFSSAGLVVVAGAADGAVRVYRPADPEIVRE